MNWIILFIAGLFEVRFTFSLGQAKLASGNMKLFWYISFGVCLTLGMGLLIKATQTLPLGTAYAVWTGIGAVGTVLIGYFVFKEPMSGMRMFFLSTLIASLIGLKLVS